MVEYTDVINTDVAWLPQIPAHWKLVRNKYIMSEQQERTETGTEPLLSLSQYTGITVRGKGGKAGMREAESLIGYKIVKKNDIVMNIMLAWNGSTAKSQFDGVISTAYAVFHVVDDDVSPDYLHYLYRTPWYLNYFEAFSTGIIKSRLRLYPESFFRLVSIVPPRAEQDQIVRFLDWKVSEINKKVALKRRLLDLIKELINSAFAALVENKSETVRLKRVVSLENDYIEINPDESYRKAGMYNRGRGIFLRDAVSGKEMGDSRFQRIHSGRLMLSGQFAWEDAVFVTSSKD